MKVESTLASIDGYVPPVERWLGRPSDPLYDKIREKHAADKIEDCVLGDFRKSFRYSNGSARLQAETACLIGMHYNFAGPEVGEATQEALEVPERVWRTLAMPPPMHSPEDNDHIEREGRINWFTFRERLGRGYAAEAIADMEDGLDHYGSILSFVAHMTIDKDIKYLNRGGRPQRQTHEQRYNSFFRKYVLESQSTGSPVFNQIFTNMRERVLELPPDNMPTLAALWRWHHRDEFYPANLLAEASPQYDDVFSDRRSIGEFRNAANISNIRTLSHAAHHFGAIAIDNTRTISRS